MAKKSETLGKGPKSPKCKFKVGDKVTVGLWYKPYIFEGVVSETNWDGNDWIIFAKDNYGHEVFNTESEVERR